jgi:hypothetical protein
VAFFNSTDWAFFVQVDYFRVARYPPRITDLAVHIRDAPKVLL